MKNKKWLRVRFYTKSPDWRPISWPPSGPFWCSGEQDREDGTHHVLIAYVKKIGEIMAQWPEAEIESFEPVDKIIFTTRFQKDDWWNEEKDSPNAEEYTKYAKKKNP